MSPRPFSDELGVSEAVSATIVIIVLVTVTTIVYPLYSMVWTRDAEADFEQNARDSFLEIQKKLYELEGGESADVKVPMNASPFFLSLWGGRAGSFAVHADQNMFNDLNMMARCWFYPDRTYVLEGGGLLEGQSGIVQMLSPPMLVDAWEVSDNHIGIKTKYIWIENSFLYVASEGSAKVEIKCEDSWYEHAPLLEPNMENVIIDLEDNLHYLVGKENTYIIKNSELARDRVYWIKRAKKGAVAMWENAGDGAGGVLMAGIFGHQFWYYSFKENGDAVWYQVFEYEGPIPAKQVILKVAHQIADNDGIRKLIRRITLDNTPENLEDEKMEIEIWRDNSTSKGTWEVQENDITKYITRQGKYAIKLYSENMGVASGSIKGRTANLRVRWDNISIVYLKRSDYWMAWRGYLEKVKKELNSKGYNAKLSDDRLRLIIKGKDNDRTPGNDIFYYEEAKRFKVFVSVASPP